LLGIFAVGPRSAIAQDVGLEVSDTEVVFRLGLGYRMRLNQMTSFAIDDRIPAAPATPGQRMWLEHRLRLQPVLALSKTMAIRAEFDALSGLLGGDTTQVGGRFLRDPQDTHRGVSHFDLRHAYLDWTTPAGLVRLGQQGSDWGMGLLANAGAQSEIDESFSDRRFGDLVWRALWATRPARLFSRAAWADALVLGLGADTVWRDANASFEEGDRAYQGIVSLMWRTDTLMVGVYSALRRQTDREDAAYHDKAKLEANAFDALVKWNGRSEGAPSGFGAMLEGVFISGHTTRTATELAKDGADIRSFALAARGTWESDPLGILVKLESGVASGDNNRSDGVLRHFTMNPDHKVGMLLFDEVLGRMYARSADNASDPALVAVPAKGVRFLPTNGAITNALYVNPIVRWRPRTFGDALGARIGVLWARAVADLVDPFASAQVGGYNRTFLGVQGGSRTLGWEFDGALDWTFGERDGHRVRLGAQGGVLLPGAAFDRLGANGTTERLDTIWKVRGTFDWLF